MVADVDHPTESPHDERLLLDVVIVIAYAVMDDAEAKKFKATVVKVDAKNRIVKVLRK